MTKDEAATPPRNKGGRPLKDPSKGKRGNYSFRMTDITRAQIGRKADEAGRSLSEEVEFRIDQSLLKDTRVQAILEMVGGPEMTMFSVLVYGGLRIAIEEANKTIQDNTPWEQSPEKIRVVQQHMAQQVQGNVETFASMKKSGVALRLSQHFQQIA